MKEALKDIGLRARHALAEASSPKDLESLRIHFLGKKGEISLALAKLGGLPPQERPLIGQVANDLRREIGEALEARSRELQNELLFKRLKEETLDVTLPSAAPRIGHIHPMTRVLTEVIDIFLGMGFSVAEGPEVETTWHCFTALNHDAHHPARDKQDTFYITDDIMLRTQTSSVQIRHMLNHAPPIRIISPGRVFRKDEVDATHSPMFHQIEGLVVDKGITMAHLKHTLETLMKALYGPDTTTRFRPHHFPYTEPSAEVDIQCYVCGGRGCRVCKGEGFIELLGCGMVHPKVLSTCGINPDVYTGFAFGIGLERITLGRFSIDDMRLLFENDMRFLAQY